MDFAPFIVILLCALLKVYIEATDTKQNSEIEEDLFVPTHDWQVIKQRQKIPKGLHVRINLQTGVREAKILNEKESTDTKTAIVSETTEEDTKRKFSKSELQEALKNIKNEDADSEDSKKILNEFKSYEELKNDLDSLNIHPRTDNEILAELIKNHKNIFKKPANEDCIITILEDLEFLVHQIDNANDFVKMNGFEEVIYPNLNSTNTKIKESCLKLLGSCLQNNAKVQIYALKTGAVGTLLKMLVLNSEYTVKSRIVFALGCLLRHFPLAQLKFVKNGGLNIFGSLLETSGDLKIRLKVATLINDLLLEHEDALFDFNNLNKLQQYDQIHLKNMLKDHNWGVYLGKLLIDVVNVDANDHDSVEKALVALVFLDESNLLNQSDLIKVLVNLRVQYKSLSVTDDYFEHLTNLCNKIIKVYKKKSEL